jgi:hypothetical protein
MLTRDSVSSFSSPGFFYIPKNMEWNQRPNIIYNERHCHCFWSDQIAHPRRIYILYPQLPVLFLGKIEWEG